MATINPASLYSQNEGIFNARPYVWHEEQLQAHQDAKDDALNEYYKNLPNTINDKGLRDIDVPGVNEARNALSQNFIQNKKNILKGNTPESYNYQKQVRDLQGKVQEGLNAAQVSNKISALKTDPNKASMFYGDDKFNQQQSHNLSVFDPTRKGIDLTNFTATPKEYTDADLSKEMGKYKPAGLSDLIKQPDPTDNTKEQVTSVPKYDATQLDQMKLSSLYRYNNNIGYKEKVDKMVSSPDARPLLDNLFQHYYNRTPASGNEYSMAYDLSKLPITIEKRTIVTNGQQKYEKTLADRKQAATVSFGRSMQKIAANKAAGIPIDNSGYVSDEVADAAGQDLTVRENGKNVDKRVIYTDKVDPSRLDIITGKNLSKNKLGVSPIPIKQPDGTLKLGYYQDKGTGNWIGEDNQVISRDRVKDDYINSKANTKFKVQSGTTGKETKKATVPVQQKAPTKKGKYD